ncbi:SigE family RNA polymerase sigma factor [Terrabacter sp. NPDC000476]|uniref:SigE family RNA polymerase sigma factor n=1 Tax=Terrabacter sp. NPDC000476 TaxID=3154258 RepID=UPI00331CEE33
MRDFEEFFASSARPLRRTAYGLVGDWDRAEDLTQAAFVRLYRHWDRIQDVNVEAYARRVLVNLYIDERKFAAEVPTDVLPERGRADEDRSTSIDIGRALATLPRQARAVIVLRYLDDRPVAEVAEVLGIAEGTVKSHTHRGMSALSALLSPATELRSLT